MLNVIYKVALLLVVICVLIILIAPNTDLPDSPPLRANHGASVVLQSIDLFFTFLLLMLMAFLSLEDRENISTQFDSPSLSSLCIFLC